MDWMDQVLEKAKRKNQILFPKDSPLLHGLAQLLPRQDRRVLILWALDLAEETVQALETRLPVGARRRRALSAGGDPPLSRPGQRAAGPGGAGPVSRGGTGLQRGSHRRARHGIPHL